MASKKPKGQFIVTISEIYDEGPRRLGTKNSFRGETFFIYPRLFLSVRSAVRQRVSNAFLQLLENVETHPRSQRTHEFLWWEVVGRFFHQNLFMEVMKTCYHFGL